MGIGEGLLGGIRRRDAAADDFLLGPDLGRGVELRVLDALPVLLGGEGHVLRFGRVAVNGKAALEVVIAFDRQAALEAVKRNDADL